MMHAKHHEDMQSVPLNTRSCAEEDKALEALTKQVARGGGIVAIGSVIGKICNFALQILLGRVLGAGAYGVYALGLSVTSIASSISSLGLQNGVVRFISIYRGEGDKARIKSTLISALALSLVFSIVVAGLLFTLSNFISLRIFHEPELIHVLRIFALAIPFYVLMTITSFSARAFRKMGYSVGVTSICQPITNISFVGIAFLIGFKLDGAVSGFLISMILSAALGTYFLRRVFPELTAKLRPIYETKRLIRFSSPVFLEGFSALLLIQTDKIMLGYFSTISDIGLYSAASRTAMQIPFIMSALMASFSPVIADLYNKRKYVALEELFKSTTRWIILLTLPIALILMLFARNIMSLFGVQFMAASLVLIILSFAQVIDAGTGAAKNLLQMSGKQDVDLVNGLTMVGINIGLNLLLIKRYGYIGAALATAASIVLINAARILEVRILLHMNPYDKKYLKMILSAMVGTAFWLIFKRVIGLDALNWLGAAVGVVLSYAVTLFFLGLEEDDKVVLGAIRKKILGALSWPR